MKKIKLKLHYDYMGKEERCVIKKVYFERLENDDYEWNGTIKFKIKNKNIYKKIGETLEPPSIVYKLEAYDKNKLIKTYFPLDDAESFIAGGDFVVTHLYLTVEEVKGKLDI